MASLFATTASAFTPSFPVPQFTTTSSSSSTALSESRREAMESCFTSTAFAIGSILLSGQQPAQAATSSKSDEAEFNELINVLKTRSEENKEANANYSMRADKMSSKDFKDAKSRRPKLIVVQTSKGNKIYTKEEFTTLDQDGKIKTEYGMRMKQGGGEIKDYNDITYILKD